MTSRRRYACRSCHRAGCRVNRCRKADKAFLVDRLAWIRHLRDLIGPEHVSFKLLDNVWRRDHGYCTQCHRKSRRWFCDHCAKLRKGQKARAWTYRKVNEFARPMNRKART